MQSNISDASFAYRRPRFGVDAHVLDGKHQGTATYLIGLLREISLLNPPFQVVVFCSNPDQARKTIGAENFEYVQLPDWNSALRLSFSLPYNMWKHNIDLSLYQYINPIFLTKPYINVIHDLLPFSHPHLFPFLFRASRRLLFNRTLRSAPHIVAVSEFAGTEIRARAPSTANRLLQWQIGPSFPPDALLQDRPLPLPAPLKEGEKFVLCVGRIEKRKNVDLLTRSFLDADLPGVRLVIVGRQDLGYPWQRPDSERIIQLESLDQEPLLSLIKRADLFVLPSAAEGFGIPLLDALLAGAPAIYSNQTAMPYVAGSLGRAFDPTAPDACSTLRDMMRGHFCSEPIPRPSPSERLELSNRFSYRNAAKVAVSDICRILELNTAPG